ncbi:MAG: ATP-binding protein, partial [Spirochaetales bacterium]|nr:ATP-binding protein [Spirochaetales bacterium]
RVESRTQEVLALQRENTRLRIIEEREQLYSDMHDSIGARLTNINICNTVAVSELHKNTVMVEDMLKRIDSNCEVAIDDMKRLISRNSNLVEDEPLLGDEMVERIRNRLAIRGILLRERISVPPGTFDGRRSHQIKEILEELVSNVLKYSQADSVHLNAKIRHDELILEFSDDGVGLGSGGQKSGFGLRNIRKRLERLEGRCTMHSAPGRGVRFHITVPVG